MSKTRLIITSVVIEGRTHADVAREYGVSPSWVSRLITRYRTEGEAAQRHKLGAFIARQPGQAAVIDSSLRHPVANTAVRDPQITGDLRDRLLTQPSKLDSTTPELRRM